ncbi:MAG: DUF2624 family protein [Bacilli bacterium]
MYKSLIKAYVESITKSDIYTFATKENIEITKEETDIIFNAIKNDTDIILSSDFPSYMKKYNNILSQTLINKILEYYKKYENFLS